MNHVSNETPRMKLQTILRRARNLKIAHTMDGVPAIGIAIATGTLVLRLDSCTGNAVATGIIEGFLTSPAVIIGNAAATGILEPGAIGTAVATGITLFDRA